MNIESVEWKMSDLKWQQKSERETRNPRWGVDIQIPQVLAFVFVVLSLPYKLIDRLPIRRAKRQAGGYFKKKRKNQYEPWTPWKSQWLVYQCIEFPLNKWLCLALSWPSMGMAKGLSQRCKSGSRTEVESVQRGRTHGCGARTPRGFALEATCPCK